MRQADFGHEERTARVDAQHEIEALRSLLASSRQHYQTDPHAAQELMATGIAPVRTDLDPVELAAWTTVGRAILNLNETITRN